eukprot:c29995_g1_i1 orf=257-1081(+)
MAQILFVFLLFFLFWISLPIEQVAGRHFTRQLNWYPPPYGSSSSVSPSTPPYGPSSPSGSTPQVPAFPSLPPSTSSPIGSNPSSPDYGSPPSGTSPVTTTPPSGYTPGSPPSGSLPGTHSPPYGYTPSGAPTTVSPIIGSSPTGPPIAPVISSPVIASPPPSSGRRGSCRYWRHNTGRWPNVLSALSTIARIFGSRAASIFGGRLTLMEALQSQNSDSYRELARQGTAALLNSYSSSNYVISTNDVLQQFNNALDSPADAARQAAIFEEANLRV